MFGSILMNVSVEIEEANKANKHKIQEAVDKYWDACKYPRKKKKKIRTEALKEYEFWINIDKWYEQEFVDFIKELSKVIKGVNGTPLTKKDEFEWMDLFEENKKKALDLKAEIDKTDKEIDRMVYELYGLSEEEIKIVEGV